MSESYDSTEEMFAALSLEIGRTSRVKRFWWRLQRFPREFRYWFKVQTKYRWQRGKRGWATNDTWSFDNYLSGVIAGGVRELIANNHGYPSEMCSCTTALGDPHLDCDGATKWEAILNEMATGFEIYASVYDLELGSDVVQAKLERSLELLSKHFGSLWD